MLLGNQVSDSTGAALPAPGCALKMREATSGTLRTVLLVIVVLACGAGAVAILRPAATPGYSTGDYTAILNAIGSSVVLFTIPGCDYCALVREWLDRNDVEFREVSLVQHPEYRKLLADLTDMLGVPITIIGDTLVYGYNTQNLARALRAYREVNSTRTASD